MTIEITAKHFRVLLEILDDYLRLVGRDPDRKVRIRAANDLLKQFGLGTTA